MTFPDFAQPQDLHEIAILRFVPYSQGLELRFSGNVKFLHFHYRILSACATWQSVSPRCFAVLDRDKLILSIPSCAKAMTAFRSAHLIFPTDKKN